MTCSNRDAPATGAFDVTPSDSADLGKWTRALYIGGDGALKVTMEDGSVATFAAITAGTLLPIATRRIWATGTSATNIVALY